VEPPQATSKEARQVAEISFKIDMQCWPVGSLWVGPEEAMYQLKQNCSPMPKFKPWHAG
jgi:hypothetical protein